MKTPKYKIGQVVYCLKKLDCFFYCEKKEKINDYIEKDKIYKITIRKKGITYNENPYAGNYLQEDKMFLSKRECIKANRKYILDDLKKIKEREEKEKEKKILEHIKNHKDILRYIVKSNNKKKTKNN